MKKLLIAIIMLSLLMFAPSMISANNGLTYTTFTYSNTQGRVVPTQDAYLPLNINRSIEGLTLNEPEDITIDKEDNMYIADTKNKRIIKYSLKTEEIRVIGDGFLIDPKGVHVGLDGHLYVADLGHKKAFKFVYDSLLDDYVVEVTYEKPQGSVYFSELDKFEPTKVVTDKGNNVYLVLAGAINGLAEFKNNGEFFGFFGGNRIPNTWDNIVKSLLFDEEQRRTWFKMIPKPVYNTAVDQNGLILTTTKDVPGYLKLNIANFVYSKSNWGFNRLEDLFVGPSDTIFAVNNDGYITEYTAEGQVLFIFSGKDYLSQKGLFQSPSSIAVDSKNNIYVLDKGASSLQVFIPTQFADLVHEAITLYQQGRYQESKGPWQEVLKMNALFDLANKGIGDAFFAEGNYETAMQYYEISRHSEGYSNAYWEVRNEALLDSASWIIYVIIGLIVLSIVNRFIPVYRVVFKPIKDGHKCLKRFKLYNELMFGFYLLRHPQDGYYGIKRENKTSNFSAFIYLMLFFLSYIFYGYNTNFQFNNKIPSEIDFLQEIITVFVPFFLFVIGNYLVCSIRDGEGKLRDVFQSSAYTLLPFIIALPILSIMSHGLTGNEAFIYSSLFNLAVIVFVIYMIVMVKEIHFYEMKQTLGNIFISIFTGLMILLMVGIVYILLNEIVMLFVDIFKEVTSRG
jgi:tetratricopeptide (TPR) repeat protein